LDKYKFWLDEIEREEKAHDKYRKKARQTEERYNSDTNKKQEFNILWSNTKTTQSAVLSNTPKPDVRRRFLSDSKVEREVAEVLEKALSYSTDQYDFKGTLDKIVEDLLVTGLGVSRVHYKPFFTNVKSNIDLEPKEIEDEFGVVTVRYYNDSEEILKEKVQFNDSGDPFFEGFEEKKTFEEVYTSQVPWAKFRWQVAESWNGVAWAAIDHMLTRQELVSQFGLEMGESIPLLYSTDGKQRNKDAKQGSHALVYEIFDKRARKYRYLAQGMQGFIKIVDDPLKLEGFYPFPEPLMDNVKSGDLVPKPEYYFYEVQALELELISRRLTKLTAQLKYRGIYDSSFPGLGDLANGEDGDLKAVDDFKNKFPKGRLEDVIAFMPLEELIRVITSLSQRREEVKQTIYEIIGISDIIRGVSKASETLGAQEIKKQFAGLRINQRQQRVERFIRDIYRIKSEIIAENFSADTLTLMTGTQVTDEMLEIMQNDLLRSYKIDVETDSTVFQDSKEEQKNRVDALSAITSFMQQAFPLIQAGFLDPEIAKEMVLFGIRSFKGARQLEDAIEAMGNKDAAGSTPAPAQIGGQVPENGIPAGVQDPRGDVPEQASVPIGLEQIIGQ